MLITTQHPNGAPKLQFHGLYRDQESNILGYKIGYCPCGCLEPLVIRMSDIYEILDKWHYIVTHQRESVITKIKKNLVLKLGGKVE